MYLLSLDEMFECVDQLITTIEANEVTLGSVVVELAHQLREELLVATDN